jgi:hypothetical protein
MALQDVAKSLLAGDNFSKLIGVGILILTATNFFKIGNQGDETRAEVDRRHQETQQKIAIIYGYQSNYIQYLRGLKTDQQKILAHFGLESDLPDMPDLQPLPTPSPRYDYRRD